MADVGASSRKTSLKTKPSNEPDFNMMSVDDSINKIEQVGENPTVKEAAKKAARELTQTLINKHFNNLEEPLHDLESDEHVQAILSDESKMGPLLDHLRTVNELSDDDLGTVRAHYSLGSEIAKAEEAKKKAAMEEDYEAAAMYKKKIL